MNFWWKICWISQQWEGRSLMWTFTEPVSEMAPNWLCSLHRFDIVSFCRYYATIATNLEFHNEIFDIKINNSPLNNTITGEVYENTCNNIHILWLKDLVPTFVKGEYITWLLKIYQLNLLLKELLLCNYLLIQNFVFFNCLKNITTEHQIFILQQLCDMNRHN